MLSFDPDAAGQGAAVKSCDLLVREGFQVNVTVLPGGQDPDVFVRQHGGAAYQAAIDEARPYLDFLMERAAAQHDLADAQGRANFLREMLQAAAGIPDAPGRDYFADRIAHRAGITEDVVRQEIRSAAVARKPAPAPARSPRTWRRSSTSTFLPARARYAAFTSPLCPPPITTTSYLLVMRCVWVKRLLKKV